MAEVEVAEVEVAEEEAGVVEEVAVDLSQLVTERAKCKSESC